MTHKTTCDLLVRNAECTCAPIMTDIERKAAAAALREAASQPWCPTGIRNWLNDRADTFDQGADLW